MKTASKALIIFPTDGKGGNLDDDGAFIPEAARVEAFYRRVFPGIDVTRAAVKIKKGELPVTRRRMIYNLLTRNTGNDLIVFLCHGTKSSLPSFGFTDVSRTTGAIALGQAIAQTSPQVSKVVLYCCSVATGPENFARRLFTEMENRRESDGPFSVFGHYIKGHTTMNPCIKIYDSGFAPFAFTKKPLTGYNALKMTENFKQLMRDQKSDVRFMVPFIPEIIRDLIIADHYKRRI